MLLSSEMLIIVEKLFPDLMWNQQQNQMNLMQETLHPYRAALHRSVVKAAEARDDHNKGDAVFIDLQKIKQILCL